MGVAGRGCLLCVPGSPEHDVEQIRSGDSQIGLDEVKRDEAEMLAIVQQLGFADIKSFNAALKANPKGAPDLQPSALIDDYKGYIAQMKPKLPELFGTTPEGSTGGCCRCRHICREGAIGCLLRHGTPDGSGRAECMSTSTTSQSARSRQWKRCRTTRAFQAIICRSRLRRS